MLLTKFHLMVINADDGHVAFDKVLKNAEGQPHVKALSIVPHRGMFLTLDVPFIKKYVVWNAHINLTGDGIDSAELEIELLDPDETSVYPKMR